MKETKKSKRKSIEKNEKHLQSKGITLIALVITKGVLASSTGNVYGIYDLSGGAYEYVASYYSESTNLLNGSQLVNETNREYVTAYKGDAGIFYFYMSSGAIHNNNGFRICLTV